MPAIEPLLPMVVGPISSLVMDLLSGARTSLDGPLDVDGADPYGLDLQLALYACYELHYRGFAGVSGSWEWDPVLLGLRGRLERLFLDAVSRDVGDIDPDETAEDAMAALSVEPVDGTGLSYFLRDERHLGADARVLRPPLALSPQGGRPTRVRDPAADRRRQGAFVAVEYDEYGAGRGERVHQHLFANLLDAAELDRDLPAATSTTCLPTLWRWST